MAIKNYEMYHGTVLTRILRKDVNTSLKLVETDKDSSSTYIINDNFALYIIYRTGKPASKHVRFTFSFGENQIEEIKKYYDNYKLKFALVCVNNGNNGLNSEVCMLYEDEINGLIDLNSKETQRINVYLEKGKSFRVDGTKSKRSKEKIINRNRINTFEIPS